MAIGGLGQLLSFSDELVSIFYQKVLPQALKFITISIYMIWKHFSLIKASRRYASAVDKKSVKIRYTPPAADRSSGEHRCSICLAEFQEEEEVRELVECGHWFHGACLERWLKEGSAGAGATCPLCRNVVVPESVMSAYRRVQTEQQSIDWIEEELAIILLKALPAATCNGRFRF